ncbi:hypothetical protein P2G88_16735 [Aliiglaciecola sp. CAU 1673]|uniref:hypothetical protein n=1 Tax=Aliiglaciecola sp. CAU 1673 TaxID=3032595 RepID=UPI0023DA598B|nr:hypothetical protein [Aliiglaciecola sp. CAU 1673]MDF2179901.1 hypothetical protein [Aliiglaciecola sp. CAU 1673]
MNKREIYIELVKKSVVDHRVLMLDTLCELNEEGEYKNQNVVFNEVLKPILKNSEYIALPGYKRNWLGDLDKSHIPEWVRVVEKYIYNEGRRNFLRPEIADVGLYEFWANFSFSTHSSDLKNKELYSMASPLIKIRLDKIPFKKLFENSSFVSPVLGFWSKAKPVKGWGPFDVDDRYIYLYLLTGLSQLYFFGSETSLSIVTEKSLRSIHWETSFEEHFEFHKKMLTPNPGESLKDASERLWNDYCKKGKCF